MNHPYSSIQEVTAIEEMVLVSGTALPELTSSICEFMRIRQGKLIVDTFSDGEVRVEFGDNIRGKEVYIVQSICTPVNDSLMELALIADAARRSSAQGVTAVVPYLGYSRQDRRPHGDRTPISARVIADILTVVGVNRLVTIDVHAEQIQGFYNFPVDNVYAAQVLLADMSRTIGRFGTGERPVMISPDVGAVVRARALAKMLDTELAIIDKRRPAANIAEVMHIIGDVKDRHCFLVDDVVDTAGTLCAAGVAVLAAGAKSVRAYCTHPILSGNAITNIIESGLAEVVCTDTIPLSEKARACDKIRPLSVAELLAETITRVHGKQSVGSLFMS